MLIDLYCERTAAGFWNEPLNALSNVGFLLAAAVAWRSRRRRGNGDIWELLVIALAALIGVGSFLFHTFANSWSELADVVPIWSFVAGFVLLTIYRGCQHDLAKTVRIALIAIALIVGMSQFTGNDTVSANPDATRPLNGSLQYAPAWSALLVFTLLAWRNRHPARVHLAAATLIFSLALACRTTDLIACEITHGIGTHFLWHLLNALMIGILLLAMTTHMPPQSSGPTHR
ncbi:ceramidase domain-containing protein [Granulosicoccus sp. 3-233]|uniref:ceramidase domain-containing protein n=1 Tax=Granulosicoccus sp. 3-233 TaxID=3417969 RepID=UPI003D32DD27